MYLRIAVRTENSVQFENAELTTIRETIVLSMSNSLFVALLALIASGFRTRAALQAEILALRHQLAVLQKNAPRRLRIHRCDRLLWVVLYRCWPGWRRCLEKNRKFLYNIHRRRFTVAVCFDVASMCLANCYFSSQTACNNVSCLVLL